jgi:aryl-alcohol dehydrogenase-like predicted oxidoreductase
MPLDHYVTLGRSGLRVSPLCLGAMTFGEDLGFGSPPAVATAILDRFVERGGNFVDTANVYTRGHSEKIIGDHVGRHSSRRHRLVLATKFFGNLHPGDPNGGGAGRKAIIHQLEESLRRLQTDFVDLYWMHVWDMHTPVEETLRALDDLTRAGKVRHVGFSDTPAWKVTQAQMLTQMRGWAPLIALQVEYSLLERTVEGELVPMARELGLGITPWSPLKAGVLSGRYTRENAGKVKADRGAWVDRALGEKTYAVLDVVTRVATELGSTPARVAIAWLMQKPGVASPILGARTVEQLEDNLAAADLKLRPADVEALDKVTRPTLNFPADFVARGNVYSHGGITVNGQSPPQNPHAPQTEDQRH